MITKIAVIAKDDAVTAVEAVLAGDAKGARDRFCPGRRRRRCC